MLSLNLAMGEDGRSHMLTFSGEYPPVGLGYTYPSNQFWARCWPADTGEPKISIFLKGEGLPDYLFEHC